MDFNEPWHLTVVRTRGLLFVRPEKSWRPIVTISVVDGNRDHGLPHEVMLGSDGQNPNVKKSVIPIHDVTLNTRLVIQVFHRSQTKKKHRKRSLVGSANVSLSEFLNRNPLPHRRPVDFDVRLSCPPPQRKSPTIGGRQQHNATLTMRFHVPHQENVDESPPLSPMSDHHETDGLFSEGMLSDGPFSSKAQSDTAVQSSSERVEDEPWGKQPEPERLDGTAGLRRRRKRRVKGFHIDSDSDACYAASSSEEEFSGPPTPQDEYFPPIQEECSTPACEEQVEAVVFAPRMLPVSVDQVSIVSVQASLSFAEACIDRLGPYHELCEGELDGDCDKAEKVLGRLLTEWYIVGASLLALAGIDAAVFGFGDDALVSPDGFERGAVSMGAIAAGIGLVCDAWFLVLYSNANAQKFLRLAKDVYGSYFFFCLTCRLPTLCMFLSALSLMAFLLAVAWKAWPSAVLVMSFVAGFLLTSQFLVYGVHRFVNLVIWVVRVCWKKVAGRGQSMPPQQQPAEMVHPPPHSTPPRVSQERMEMPIPSPTPAPDKADVKMDMVWVEERAVSSEDP
ncbi:hypothetical protein C8Q76DRAFT_427469 [Earliella scabrosa]|nr:hypothetical protein C8Q76DRAFT_427469 [Earliella scabrosa]